MELRAYWGIIWRRIWLVALVVLVVALYVGYQYYHLRKTPGALTAYSSSVTMQIGLQSNNNNDPNYSDNISVSESLADALITSPILSTKEFDSDVSGQIGKDMAQITQRYGTNPNLGDWQNTSAIGGALSAVRSHSVVTITATWTTPAGAWAIANAIGEISTDHISTYINYVIPQNAASLANNGQPAVTAKLLSSASNAATVPGSSVSKQTLLVLLLIAALVIGIALAFLADYLDDRIRSKDAATNLLQLPIYGEVPRTPAPGNGQSSRRSPSQAA